MIFLFTPLVAQENAPRTAPRRLFTAPRTFEAVPTEDDELVRDRIPAMIEADGETSVTRRVEDGG